MAWLYAPEVACLLNKDISSIQKATKAGRYVFRYVKGKGRGGRVLQIALESLPEEAQARYHGQQPPVATPTPIDDLTADQLQSANFRKGCVSEYHRYGLSPQDYVLLHNESVPDQPITVDQLFRWQRILRDGGGLAELADKRGGHNKGQWSMTDEAWETFCGIYYTQQRRSAQWCWETVQRMYPDIPSVDAFRRRMKAEVPKLAEIELRQGPSALRDNLPSVERDRTCLDSNDVWVSDHHKMDVFVRDQRGRVVRPWLTVFMDERSRRVMGWLMRAEDPSATAIKQCLQAAVEENETTPREFYFDNGADYRSKFFNQDFPMSLVSQAGIGTIYATPYHGQAKGSVERWFGTVESRFGKIWPTYAGKDAKNRPECMRISNAKIAEIAPDWDTFVNAFANYIVEYNNTEGHRGQGMDGKCPEQVYFENLKEKRTIRDRDALALLCGTTEKRVVHKNGIHIKKNVYSNDVLLNYIGQEVMVTFANGNIDQVAVFDMEINAICMAKAKNLTMFRGTTEEDYANAERERKAARKVSRDHSVGRKMDTHDIIALRQLEDKLYTETGDVSQLEQLPVKALNNSKVLKDSAEHDGQPNRNSHITGKLHERYKRKQAIGG